MRSPSTIRRELRRLNGVLKREDIRVEEKRTIRAKAEAFRQALAWALDGGNRNPWRRPSSNLGMVKARAGER